MGITILRLLVWSELKLTKNRGSWESLVGVYSPNLLKINLNFVSNLIINKNIKQTFNILNNLQKINFFLIQVSLKV